MLTTVERLQEYRAILNSILVEIKKPIDTKAEEPLKFAGNIPTNITTRQIVKKLNDILSPYDDEIKEDEDIKTFLANVEKGVEEGKDVDTLYAEGIDKLKKIQATEVTVDLPKYNADKLPLNYGNAQLTEWFSHLVVEAGLI
jgi:hypothetical protein